MGRNPFIRNIKQAPSKPLDHQSAGILDDFAIRKDIKLLTGTIEHTPNDEKDITNKEYVDGLIRGNLQLFLANNASDIATYKDLEVDAVTAAKETITQTITANSTTLIEEFASKLNEAEIDSISALEHGIYDLHIHSLANFVRGMTIYFEFYKRTAGGTETLLGTSHDSNELPTSEIEFDIHANISTEVSWVAGDRVVVKIYGRNTNSVNRDISISMEGDTLARVEFPSLSIFKSFVPPPAPNLKSPFALVAVIILVLAPVKLI